MKIKLLFSLVFISILSCSEEDKTMNTDAEKVDGGDSLIVAGTLPSIAIDAEDSIVYDQLNFPADSIYESKLLTEGTFHENEVQEGASKVEWFGVFKRKSGTYIATTKIETSKVRDEILDSENDKSGWKIKVLNKDTNIFVLSKGLLPGKIEEWYCPKQYIWPGDSIAFNYLGKRYVLFATGEKRKLSSDPDWYMVSNYKLYLTVVKNGRQITELMVAHPNFDDTMIVILFAADMDGDGFLDFYIDTSRHYNGTLNTLYLTKPAGDTKIFKVIAMHSSVGC